MVFTEDFYYKRNFFIRDLARPNIIFSRCEQIEFDSFDSFIKNYLSKENMLSLINIKRLIIPIESTNQISQLYGLKSNSATFLFYLKNLDKEIVSELKSLTTSNFGIFLDYDKVLEFKNVLESLPEEGKKEITLKLSQTHGAFRVVLNKNNLNSFLDNLFKPYLEFPFFNFCDLIIEFHTFENTELKDLHQLIYYFKYIYKNLIASTASKELNWERYNSDLKAIKYPFKFMGRNGSELYILDNCVTLSGEHTEGLPEYNCDFLNQDGNFLSMDLLNRFLGAVSIGFDKNMFVSKRENFLCNENLTSLPYLNRIICNVLDGGDI